MNIEQIISTVRDQEARDHIRRQYQSEREVLGERKALEYARFRANSKADANDNQAAQTYLRALIVSAIYAAALAFVIGFVIGRAV